MSGEWVGASWCCRAMRGPAGRGRGREREQKADGCAGEPPCNWPGASLLYERRFAERRRIAVLRATAHRHKAAAPAKTGQPSWLGGTQRGLRLRRLGDPQVRVFSGSRASGNHQNGKEQCQGHALQVCRAYLSLSRGCGCSERRQAGFHAARRGVGRQRAFRGGHRAASSRALAPNKKIPGHSGRAAREG